MSDFDTILDNLETLDMLAPRDEEEEIEELEAIKNIELELGYRF